MFHDVVAAQYRGDYKIELKFDDGTRGVVDFSRFLKRGGVFARFKDLAFFKDFTVNPDLGVLTWGEEGEEVDVSPETLYAEATGTPLPAWMTSENGSAPAPAARPPRQKVPDE